jgi:hypothetical protein
MARDYDNGSTSKVTYNQDELTYNQRQMLQFKAELEAQERRRKEAEEYAKAQKRNQKRGY